jgi:hypothetical protein
MALDNNGEIVNFLVDRRQIAPLRQRKAPTEGGFSFKIRFDLTTMVRLGRREKLDPQFAVALH